MKKYKCPYCKENTFSFWNKFWAGGMASKGKACPACGKHAVHGLYSTLFRSMIMGIAFIFIYLNFNYYFVSKLTCAVVLIGAYLIGKLANGLYFDLEVNNRRDLK